MGPSIVPALILCSLLAALPAVAAASAFETETSGCAWGVMLGGNCTGIDGRPACGEGDYYVNGVNMGHYRWAICVGP
jgi:hypothetical protein